MADSALALRITTRLNSIPGVRSVIAAHAPDGTLEVTVVCTNGKRSLRRIDAAIAEIKAYCAKVDRPARFHVDSDLDP